MTDPSPDDWTCDKGLAANAALPARLGALMAAMADLLDNHTRALPAGDADAERERAAYDRLATDQRAIAARLDSLAAAMAGYETLPAAPHEMSALADRKSRETLAAFADAEEAAAALLRDQAEELRAMLSAMDVGPEDVQKGGRETR